MYPSLAKVAGSRPLLEAIAPTSVAVLAPLRGAGMTERVANASRAAEGQDPGSAAARSGVPALRAAGGDGEALPHMVVIPAPNASDREHEGIGRDQDTVIPGCGRRRRGLVPAWSRARPLDVPGAGMTEARGERSRAPPPPRRGRTERHRLGPAWGPAPLAPWPGQVAWRSEVGVTSCISDASDTPTWPRRG